MNKEQAKVLSAITEWMKIAEQEGYTIPSDYLGFNIHATKSALLKRLLSGKKPFKFPPPRAYSYPWYSLLEEGKYAGFMGCYNHDDKLNLSQYLWHIVEKLNDGTYLLSYNLKEGSVWSFRILSVDEIFEFVKKLPTINWSNQELMGMAKRHYGKYGELKIIKKGQNGC